MNNASTSHGSHDCWFFLSFALKKPARRSLSSLDMYNVAPIPGLLTAPSVTIQSESLARGKYIVLLSDRDFWARWKQWSRLSSQGTRSLDSLPAMESSNGASKDEQRGRTRASTLYAPMKLRSFLTVDGGWQDDSVAMRWGLALRVPLLHVQPSTEVEVGAITVFEGDNLRLQSWRADSKQLKLWTSSSGVLPPH
jgi:hypothetical protein